MRGSPTEPGVIPLAVHDLFESISLKGIFVAGLREEIVASPQQVLEMMELGESHRHIGETNMNVHSSRCCRSLTFFRMIIESRQKMQDKGVGNACDAVCVSVLVTILDLSGSERASKTHSEGLDDTRDGNLTKLSEGVENQGGQVPYRDSKLTRILQPALGGNANTAIICNITLAPVRINHHSPIFASRALRLSLIVPMSEVGSNHFRLILSIFVTYFLIKFGI
ncbi:unnamed protein product [Brassica oleracea]